MRILLWYWGRRGGGAQYAACLAEALARHPDVRLALSVSDRMELLDGLRGLDAELDAVPTFSGPLGAALGTLGVARPARRLAAQARRFRADLVLSAMSHVWTPLAAPFLVRAGIPFVAAVHDSRPHPGDPDLLWDWRLDRELDAASAAIAFSDPVADDLRRRRPGLSVLRQTLGAHFPGAPASGGPASATPAAALPAPVPGRFLFFGRIRAYKGLDLLAEAFRLLRRRHPGATLQVVGEGDLEGCAPGLAALPGVAAENRWADEAEMAALLAGAWATVLPYREASQSGVLPLAFAVGTPVVATPVGALPEQVGAAGTLAAAVTAEALAEAMARMLDPAARAGFAAEARRRGAALTDWDAQARSLLDGLRGLGLGAPGGGGRP